MGEQELTCRLAVKKTLAYRGVFSYPLSFYQLSTYLICGKRIRPKVLYSVLDKLSKSKKIKVKRKKFYLSNIKAVDWYLHSKYSKENIASLQKTFEILGYIPWISLISVTGSVAAFNSKKEDDVDVFIVTQKDRLWLTRFFVVLFLKFLGKYRTDAMPHGKVCPNIFISESNLSWPKNKRNLFIAHEVAMMWPIINRRDMYFKFIKKNDWIFRYFGNFKVNFPKRFKPTEVSKGRLVDLLEVLAMKVQLIYMKKRKTKEVTTKNLIHFNRGDNTAGILKRYRSLNLKTDI